MTEQVSKYTFFVYIVESPSAPDLYHGRSEGTLVADTLKLDLIPCVTRTAINGEAFAAALTIGLPEVMKLFPGRFPILHLSAHGATEGIQLSSGEVITWTQLRSFLVPLNQSLQGTLLLCMSACEGYSACRMAMQIGTELHPYLALVSHYGSPTWSDTAVAYLAFYHRLAKGDTIHAALEGMRASSGDPRWMLETAEEIKAGFIEHMNRNAEPLEARRELESVAQRDNLPPSAKALENGGG